MSHPHLDDACAILGEHYRNYIVIVQDDDSPSLFDMAYSCPYATTGLMIEGSKYHQSLMNASNNPEDYIEWETEDDDDEDEDEW